VACTRAQLLALLLKIRKELECTRDKQILDIYIERLERLAESEIESELWS